MAPLLHPPAARSRTAPSAPMDYGRSRPGRRRCWSPPTSRGGCFPPARRPSDRVSYPACAAPRCATVPGQTPPRTSQQRPRQRGETRASFHLYGWCVAAFAGADRRTEEHLLAVRQRNLARVRPWSAVAGPPPGHGDAITCLHRDVTLPAVSVKRTDAVALELPVDDGAAIVGDVDVEMAMRIRPLDL